FELLFSAVGHPFRVRGVDGPGAHRRLEDRFAFCSLSKKKSPKKRESGAQGKMPTARPGPPWLFSYFGARNTKKPLVGCREPSARRGHEEGGRRSPRYEPVLSFARRRALEDVGSVCYAQSARNSTWGLPGPRRGAIGRAVSGHTRPAPRGTRRDPRPGGS